MGPGASAVGRWSLLGPAQVSTCEVVSRPVPGGGSRLSLEKARTQRVAGGCPPPPLFMARSFPLAGFGVVGRSGAVVGLLRYPCTCPDLETFFHKMLFQHIFPENASQIGLSIPEVTTPLSYQRQRSPKRASESKRGIKSGVQGACPRPSFSPFLGRNGSPRRVGGATGRCAPRHRKSPDRL